MAVLTLSKDDKENIVRKLFNPAITSEYISDSWAHRIGETRHTFAEDLIHALAFDDYLDALQGLEEDEKLELLTMLKHDTSPNLPIPRWQEFLTRQVMPRDCSRLSNIMGLGDHGISKNLIKSIILPALIPPPGQQGPRPPPSFRAAQQLLTPEGSPAPTEALSSLVVVSNAAVQINDRLDSTYFSHDTGSSSAAEDEANTTAIQPLKSVDPAQDLSGSSTISENSILSGISSDDLDVDMKMENADTPIEVVIIGHDANANENLVGQSVGDYLPDVTSPSTVQIFHSAREGAISGASTTSPLTQVTEHGRSVSPRARVYRLDIQQPADAIDVTPSRRAASPRVIIDMPPPEVLSQFQSMAMPTRQSPRGSKRAICAEEPIDGSSAEDEISSDDGEGEDEKPDNAGGERGSSKADSSSSLDELSRSPTPFEWRKDSSEDEMEGSRANRTPKRSSKKRKRTSMTSDHFESPTPTKRKRQKTKTTRRVPAGQSAVVFPPTTADSFGIVQERLWQDPFSLIIAVLFLNKTAGKSSMPVFREVIKKYPTPEALSKANWDELFEMVKSLGLQTQRTTKLIKLANHWVDKPPEVGVRYRTLHYPAQGDGKQWRPSHVEGDAEDCAGALEIGKLPGCGRYARDSWRIFCRDVFRGVASDYNGKDAVEGFEAEWKRVLPEDKELRAFLRWMWLKEGFVWDETTGEKHAAGPDLLEKARLGQTEWTIRETTAASEERTGGSDLEQPESPVLPGSSTGALLAVDDEVNPEEPDNQLLPESDPGISDDGVNLEEPDNQLLPEDRPGRASRAAIADVQLTQHSDATQIPVLVGTANAEDQACVSRRRSLQMTPSA